MGVTSTTLAGVNVWQLSGAVTDAELKTAWAGLITNNRYLLNRTLYIDSTCSLVNVRGTYYIDSQNLGIILHLSRNKANTLFRNWFFTQTVGLSVGARSNFVRFTNGTTITNSASDGIDMQGGGMMYAVVGNPGGGDPRYLNEMMFGSLDGTLVTSAAWTEQELEPTSIGTIWRGLNIQKAAGYPILSATGGTQRQVIYRSNFNTESATLRLIRPYYNNSVCYVSSVIRRQGAAVTSNLLDTYGSNGGCVIMALNNYLDESWFGASRTNFAGANWNAGNRIIGGAMKKIQVQPSTLIRTYDSRSTTVSQKSTFSETTSDFLTGTDSTTSDASTGRAQIVCVGAIATGGSIAITRYTGQRFTLQKFGYQVQVETPDMTFGDDDLSAFSPITMTAQDGIARTQSVINAATTITSFQNLLEELHVLAIGLTGAASYAGAYTGNLFSFSGGKLTTAFTTVNVDATAASKISYNSATNTLTIKATTLTSNDVVSEWINSGAVNLLNGAKISGIYGASGVRSTNFELRNVKAGAAYIVANNSTKATILYGTNATGTAQTYTVQFPPGSAGTQIYVARKTIGDFFDFEVVTLQEGLIWQEFTDIPDEGAKETNPTVLNAYTELETNTKVYNYVTGIYMRTEAGIKLGEFFSREGTFLKWSAPYSALIKQSAGSLFSKSGNLFTIKASGLDADANYDTNVLTPPATMTADTTEVIGTEIVDANGDSSITIQGGSGSYEVWKVANGTPEDDYATGTLLADPVGLGKWRFTGVTGYYILVRDKVKNNRDTCSMEKGTYIIGLYAGKDQITVAQLPEVYELQDSLALMQIDVDNMPASVWAFIVETGHSALSVLRLMASVLVGKVSGAGTGTETFRDLNDTKDRVISSVDANGNRTDVTKDGS